MERLLPKFEKGTVAELHPLLRPLMVRFESQGSLLYGEWGHPIEAEGSYFKTSDIVGETQLLKLPSPWVQKKNAKKVALPHVIFFRWRWEAIPLWWSLKGAVIWWLRCLSLVGLFFTCIGNVDRNWDWDELGVARCPLSWAFWTTRHLNFFRVFSPWVESHSVVMQVGAQFTDLSETEKRLVPQLGVMTLGC